MNSNCLLFIQPFKVCWELDKKWVVSSELNSKRTGQPSSTGLLAEGRFHVYCNIQRVPGRLVTCVVVGHCVNNIMIHFTHTFACTFRCGASDNFRFHYYAPWTAHIRLNTRGTDTCTPSWRWFGPGGDQQDRS